MRLIDFIPVGRNNAISARDLAKLAGFKDTRSLTQEIHRLRKAGHIICSAVTQPYGFFLPESEHDIREFVHSMHGRITEIGAAVRGAEQYLQDQ